MPDHSGEGFDVRAHKPRLIRTMNGGIQRRHLLRRGDREDMLRIATAATERQTVAKLSLQFARVHIARTGLDWTGDRGDRGLTTLTTCLNKYSMIP